ncbi:MAG TPA: hypothetical protein ENK31_10380, partial [Nannocystis exedens]|nr:hypothetical protein [Nannocystis exedens]
MGRKKFVAYEAAGALRIELKTRIGDADLYVNVGAKAAPTDGAYTLLSDEYGLGRELIEIPEVPAGTTIGIAVHGYRGSEYDLEVWGPRVGEAAPDLAEPIERLMSSVVAAGEVDAMDVIEVHADGV